MQKSSPTVLYVFIVAHFKRYIDIESLGMQLHQGSSAGRRMKTTVQRVCCGHLETPGLLRKWRKHEELWDNAGYHRVIDWGEILLDTVNDVAIPNKLEG